MREGLIYLDYAATAPADESVIAAMAECMRSVPFNASAAYAAAGEARRIHRLCRRQFGDMLACPAENICSTGGGTEGNNWVMHAFKGQHAVVSAIEHHSILEPARAHGYASFVRPDSDGYIHPEAVEAAIAALDLRGILVSGGAACAARSGMPSHVYTAMGLAQKEAAQVLRISIGRQTTADELSEAARAVEGLFFCK